MHEFKENQSKKVKEGEGLLPVELELENPYEHLETFQLIAPSPSLFI